MREVEARLALVDQRALLRDAVAKNLVQREVHHVRERVRLGDHQPALVVDGALELGARFERAAFEDAHVQDVAAEGLHRRDLEARAVGAVVDAQQAADVGNLAARLREESGLVENEADDARVWRDGVNEAVARVHGAQRRGGRRVDRELGFVVREGDAAVGEPRGLLCAESEARITTLGRGSSRGRTRPLRLHRRVEARGVHREPCLPRHELCEIEREAHRVEEEEGRLPVEARLALRLQGRGALVELFDAAGEHRRERVFLVFNHRLNPFLLLLQLWESVAERGHNARHERGEEAFLRA